MLGLASTGCVFASANYNNLPVAFSLFLPSLDLNTSRTVEPFLLRRFAKYRDILLFTSGQNY